MWRGGVPVHQGSTSLEGIPGPSTCTARYDVDCHDDDNDYHTKDGSLSAYHDCF